MKRTVVLLILDGWGIGGNDVTNAIYAAHPPHMNALTERYPSGALLSHGISVGLLWEEAGTGETGHLTIGAGRAVYQPESRITLAIRDESFFANNVLESGIRRARKENSAVHLVGMLSAKNARASMEHLRALIELAQRANISRVRIHAILTGDNEMPRAAITLLKKIPWSETVSLASLAGQYYATDKEANGSRLQATENALRGIGARAHDPERYLHDFYLHGMGDEFAEPVAIGSDPRGIEKNDTVIFFNFDGVCLKPLATSLINNGAPLITLTDYGLPPEIPVAFPDNRLMHTLAEVLAHHGKTQFKIAETERYAHITYFFNGRSNNALPNEYRILVPSENRARKDERPAMMMKEVADRGIAAIEEGADFIAMNFAAPDVMAHTGNFAATIEAVRAADRELGAVAQAVLARNGALIVTADHGNAEQMRNPVTGAMETAHNKNPVPVLLIATELEKPKGSGIPSYEATAGLLSDIAPTVLAFMGIEKPKEMTGSSLIGKLI